MSLKDIASLGKLLAQFLALFADCFRRSAGRILLAVYVPGLLSDVQRKNVEAMALARGVAPRTLGGLSWSRAVGRQPGPAEGISLNVELPGSAFDSSAALHKSPAEHRV
jgi:hypothetical protein